ncbi:hypothetical protein Tco_1029628 [Tanacetum coccineum]|uniref:Uncharacterized protein n=1 Tax=Tanacetum coccineum TaxID=301880 RepID=A0ABQ5G684_9ASTR
MAPSLVLFQDLVDAAGSMNLKDQMYVLFKRAVWEEEDWGRVLLRRISERGQLVQQTQTGSEGLAQPLGSSAYRPLRSAGSEVPWVKGYRSATLDQWFSHRQVQLHWEVQRPWVRFKGSFQRVFIAELWSLMFLINLADSQTSTVTFNQSQLPM